MQNIAFETSMANNTLLDNSNNTLLDNNFLDNIYIVKDFRDDKDLLNKIDYLCEGINNNILVYLTAIFNNFSKFDLENFDFEESLVDKENLDKEHSIGSLLEKLTNLLENNKEFKERLVPLLKHLEIYIKSNFNTKNYDSFKINILNLFKFTLSRIIKNIKLDKFIKESKSLILEYLSNAIDEDSYFDIFRRAIYETILEADEVISN